MKLSSLGGGSLLCVFMLVSACVTQTRQYAFEVKRGASIEDKLNRAKALATETRLADLKVELRQKHADLTDAQLEKIGIRWTENWQVTPEGGKANRIVVITVVMQKQPGADTAAVVETAARILDAEINGPKYSVFDAR